MASSEFFNQKHRPDGVLTLGSFVDTRRRRMHFYTRVNCRGAPVIVLLCIIVQLHIIILDIGTRMRVLLYFS